MIRKIAVLALLIGLVCLSASAADISGVYKGKIVTPGGIKNYTFDFKAQGAALGGKATLNGATVDIKNGKINGDDISFDEPGDFQGKPLVITYTGKVAGNKITLIRKFATFPPDTFTVAK